MIRLVNRLKNNRESNFIIIIIIIKLIIFFNFIIAYSTRASLVDSYRVFSRNNIKRVIKYKL